MCQLLKNNDKIKRNQPIKNYYINFCLFNTTPTELSRKYGLAASTISTIVKNQEATKIASESMRDIKKAKRLREPEYK
ncbi:hypothetical protein BpHYR1_029240 [Brachionus plicatilis]|uniref:Uncharacterized protein n=1 Tax=Brachionus plicatilis TaxID=10195 RepID=A0A3M7RCL2_BRAPC|nr:hypothetical protein BpHYR1_029240 [Brachionus plicatilis]